MGRKKNIDTADIDYLYIRDITFDYSVPDDIRVPEKKDTPTGFTLEIVKMYNLEQQVVRMVLTIHLEAGGQNSKEIAGSYKTEHLFKINNLPDYMIKEGDQLSLNAELEDKLTDLVYTTVRGALWQKLNGTWFSDFLLPVLKPADL